MNAVFDAFARVHKDVVTPEEDSIGEGLISDDFQN